MDLYSFETISDIEKYPLILPNNFHSVKILEQKNNELIAEEIISEKGIRTKLIAKHILVPYESHTIEIIDGDAKGTKIIQTFEEIPSGTKISIKLELNVQGVLTPVKFFPQSNVQNAMNTVITSFIQYSQLFESNEAKIIDDLYREILLRPADLYGLQSYVSKLKTGEMTLDEIKLDILNSNEKQSMLKNSP